MKKILVVEDEADNRRIMRDLLVNAGYLVIEALTGDEGVAKAESEACAKKENRFLRKAA